jgi:hypothetical protein
LIFHCARPTRGVRDRALREHLSDVILPSLLASPLWEWHP